VGRTTLVGRVPNTLRPVFRDRDDFSAGHSLTEATKAAIHGSASLVVLCSRASAKSHYVNEEVRLFKASHPSRPVIPVIIDAEDIRAEECLPRALAYLVTGDGTITDQPAHVLAADARKSGDGRELAICKVVASMLGVEVDDIRKRQAIRESRQIKCSPPALQ